MLMQRTVRASAEPAGDRVLTVTASDESLDGHGTVVKIAGIDLARFRRNPVIMPGHDYRGLAVGRSVETWKDSVPRLRMKVEFADARHNPLGPLYYESYRDGFMHGWSIGFLTVETRKPNRDELKRHGSALTLVYERIELAEVSAVAVPSNPAAVTEGARVGLMRFAERAAAEGFADLAYELRSALPSASHAFDLGGAARLEAAGDRAAASLREAINVTRAAMGRKPHRREPERDAGREFLAVLRDAVREERAAGR